MNYRHSYHAGNIADVFKHSVLVLVLRALRQKETPFCVVDTHAGSGVYELERPGEYQQGVALLWPERENWPALSDYFSPIKKFNGKGKLKYYPGSPLVIAEFLRKQDRAVLLELGEKECRYLKSNMADIKNAAVLCVDAWKALKGLVPPQENRGLVLIDPPYEAADDFDNALAALKYGAKHWRNGVYMVWYPFKSRHIVAHFSQSGWQVCGVVRKTDGLLPMPGAGDSNTDNIHDANDNLYSFNIVAP